MSATKWLKSTRSGNPITAMTTELNSLTTTGSAIGATIQNDSDLDRFGLFELSITYGTGPTAGSQIELYFISSLDGSVFEDGSTTGPILPANGLAGSFTLRNVTTTQVTICKAKLPPEDFKPMIRSATTGQTAAASGNTLRMLAYGEQNV